MTLRVCARICNWCGWCLCFTAQFKQHTNSRITHYAHLPNAFPYRLRAFRNWMFAEPTSFLFYSYIFDDSAQFELYFWYLMKWQMWKIVWASISNALVLFSSSHEHYFILPKDTSIGYPRAGLLRKMKIGIHFFYSHSTINYRILKLTRIMFWIIFAFAKNRLTIILLFLMWFLQMAPQKPRK